MSEYPSIQNLYASNGEQGAGHKRGPEFGFSNEAFDMVKHWLVLEKVDGMNIRVVYHPYGISDEIEEGRVDFYGRTERANLPGDLLAHLQSTYTLEKLQAAFYEQLPPLDDESLLKTDYAWQNRIVLYLEGFGPGIQKGADYGGEKRTILYDVLAAEKWWLRWSDVCDVASKLDIPTVPVLHSSMSVEDIIESEIVHASELLPEGSPLIEGLVARTDPYLFDGRGRRVMFKYKVRDL